MNATEELVSAFGLGQAADTESLRKARLAFRAAADEMDNLIRSRA